MIPRFLFVTAVVVSVVAACHPQGGVEQGAPASNVITRDEIDSTHASSVYDVIARLRGEYLKDRGTVSILAAQQRARAVVFLGDHEYGVIETMRNIPPERVAMIRYYSGADAVAKFGAQYGGGVIQLIPRYE